MDASIFVQPSCLEFDVTSDRKFSHASITLQSTWSSLVAFKIRVSVRNLFVVTCGEGFLEPNMPRTIPVKLRNGEVLALDAVPVAKFALEFAEVSPQDATDSAKSFWSSCTKASILRRTVYCTVNIPHLSTTATSKPASVAPPPKSLSRSLTTMMSIEEISDVLDQAPLVSTQEDVELPQGRILQLMIKNVTKETPLLPHEIEELKLERSKLTKEQWNEWLTYARQQKQLLSATPDDAVLADVNDAALVKTAHKADIARRQSLAVIQSSLQSVWEKLEQKENTSRQASPATTVPFSSSSSVAPNIVSMHDAATAIDEQHESIAKPCADEVITVRPTIVPISSSKPITSPAADEIRHKIADKPIESFSASSTTSTANAYDIARSSVLRIDSAYSAAQCLQASLQAEQELNKTSSTSLAIITALMSSLEKSKESLHELASTATSTKHVTSVPSSPAPANSSSTQLNSTYSNSQYFNPTATTTTTVPSTPFQYRPSSTPMTKSQLDVDRYDNSSSLFNDFTTSKQDFYPLSTTISTAATHPATAAIIAKSRYNVQSAKGHPRIYRLCVSSGVLAKTFEESPLRVDIENAAVDIVWRENRTSNATTTSSKQAVLRRERFNFDDIYAGSAATAKLQQLLRKRTKQSLLTNRGLGVVVVAAGHSNTDLEPPVITLLGDRGGTGVISAVVDEIFKLLTAPPATKPTPHRYYNYPHTTTNSLPIDPVAETLTFSAVVISDGIVVDLLNSSSQKNNIRVSRKADGSYGLANVTKLLLKSSYDFERVAGVLLGRRAAMKEAAAAMGVGVVDAVPWLAVNHAENCLLFTITAPITTMSQSEVSFHFVCPCGDMWATPGTEICLVAEALACLPHSPPHSLLSAGISPRIMVDPNASELDYITIAAVNLSRDTNKQHEAEMVQNALHSLRTISQVGQ